MRERNYLSNVLPAVEWSTQSLKWLDAELPTGSDLKDSEGMLCRERSIWHSFGSMSVIGILGQ